MKGKLGMGVMALSMMGLLVGCGSSQGTATNNGTAQGGSGGTIKIGVTLPFTGPAGSNGQDTYNGMELAAALVNKSGGVLGKQIELDKRDDQSTPSVGVNMVNSLIQDGVVAFVGGYDSSVVQAQEPVISNHNVLDIVNVAKSVNFQYPNVLAFNSDNKFDGQAIGQFIWHNLQAKTVAIVYENDVFGKGAMNSSLAAWKGDGAPKAVLTEGVAFQQTSFTQELAKVKQLNPDVLYIINAAMSSGLPDLIQQVHQQGIASKVVVGVGTLGPSVVKLAGNSASEGIYSADLYFPSMQNSLNQDFVQAYKAKYNIAPDKLAFLGYESVTVMAKAMNQAGTTDAAKVSALIKANSWDTAAGTRKFDSDGRQLSTYQFYQVQPDGSFQLLH